MNDEREKGSVRDVCRCGVNGLRRSEQSARTTARGEIFQCGFERWAESLRSEMRGMPLQHNQREENWSWTGRIDAAEEVQERNDRRRRKFEKSD